MAGFTDNCECLLYEVNFMAARETFDNLGGGILQKFLRIIKSTREAVLLEFHCSIAASFSQFVSWFLEGQYMEIKAK